MSDLHTLRGLMGLPATPQPLSESALIMVDLQNTYTEGIMELEGYQAALDEAATLLDRARSAGAKVIHIQHDAGEGSPYDVKADIGAIHSSVAPRDGESIIIKNFPSSFVGTDLQQQLGDIQNLVLAGFMTHMCINSTARNGFSLGYAPTVVAAATATRALPNGTEAVPAAHVQAASLAALSDLFGIVVPTHKSVPS